MCTAAVFPRTLATVSPAGEDPTAPVVSLGSLEVGQLPALAWEGLCQVHAELSVRLRLPRQAWVSGIGRDLPAGVS